MVVDERWEEQIKSLRGGLKSFGFNLHRVSSRLTLLASTRLSHLNLNQVHSFTLITPPSHKLGSYSNSSLTSRRVFLKRDITVLSNPAKFTDPYRFKITFECMAPLEEDLEWKLIYVGSAESESFDQELDTCMVGPVPVGVNSFEFEAAAPLPSRIPSSDLIGVTVILLTCSYADQEFVRIGYYVNTEYADPDLKARYDASLEDDAQTKGISPPDPAQHVQAMVRNVLGDKPRVTRFNIKWGAQGEVRGQMEVDGTTALIPPPFDSNAAFQL